MKKKEKAYYSFKFLWLGVFLLFSHSCGYAGSIFVSPVRLELLPGQAITFFNVTNKSAEPLMAQIHGVQWTVHEGKDKEEKTKDLLISPPIIKLGPDETQIVRVALLKPLDPKTGGTYRIITKELPSPEPQSFTGVKTLLEIKIPCLVAPLVPIEPTVTFFAMRSAKNEIKIKAFNKGQSYLSFNSVTIGEEEQPMPLAQKAIYDSLIPQQSKEWTLEIPNSFAGKVVYVSMGSEGGQEIRSAVPLSTP